MAYYFLQNFKNIEFGMEYLFVRCGKHADNIKLFSFDRHVWGTVMMMGAVLVQVFIHLFSCDLMEFRSSLI